MAGFDTLDAHCRRPGCTCTHDGECYRGWLDRREDDREYAVPCRRCDPEKRTIVQQSPDRITMGERLRDPNRKSNPYPTHDKWAP